MSQRTRWGALCRASSSAWVESPVEKTEYPPDARKRSISVRIASSSSTTRTLRSLTAPPRRSGLQSSVVGLLALGEDEPRPDAGRHLFDGQAELHPRPVDGDLLGVLGVVTAPERPATPVGREAEHGGGDEGARGQLLVV